jgi:hypothetical protein
MTTFTQYRHIGTLDTDFVCLNVKKDLGDRLIVRGYMINRWYKFAYDIEDYTIQKSDLWKWKRVQG